VARGYLAIERVRFRDRMEVEERIEPGCLAWPVPPLLLQPVVENAVKHGVAPSAEPTVISVEARIDGGELLVIAENPIPAERAPRAARGGLGLDLVRRRLAAAYGGRARFEAGAVDGRFRAALFLPRETGGGA
jgi:LytS/YehU family sensor histidine kinase